MKKGDIYFFDGRKFEFICEEGGQTYYYPRKKEDLKKSYVRLLKLDANKNESFQVEKEYFKKNYTLWKK